MVPRPLTAARAMRSRTCADVIQPLFLVLRPRRAKRSEKDYGDENAFLFA